MEEVNRCFEQILELCKNEDFLFPSSFDTFKTVLWKKGEYLSKSNIENLLSIILNEKKFKNKNLVPSICSVIKKQAKNGKNSFLISKKSVLPFLKKPSIYNRKEYSILINFFDISS